MLGIRPSVESPQFVEAFGFNHRFKVSRRDRSGLANLRFATRPQLRCGPLLFVGLGYFQMVFGFGLFPVTYQEST